MPSSAPRYQAPAKLRAAQARNPLDRGQFLYTYRWQKARAAFLREHPLCGACQVAGRETAATVVDHIVPHRGDLAIFWDRSNWQPLCAECHNRKTVLSDGGLGRARQRH